jgi:hypothetical protein
MDWQSEQSRCGSLSFQGSSGGEVGFEGLIDIAMSELLALECFDVQDPMVLEAKGCPCTDENCHREVAKGALPR